MGIVLEGLGLKSNQRVVTGDNKRGKVGEELANAAEVQEDQEEVDENKTKDTVGLGDASLGLDLLEGRVLLEFLKIIYVR